MEGDRIPRDGRQTHLQEAFAASLALHALAGWLAFPSWPEQTALSPTPAPMTVRLASGPTSARTAAHTGDSSRLSPSPIAGPLGADTAVREKARLLQSPDLHSLEEIPVTTAGTLRLRLFVTAAGTVEKVEVRRSDPIPPALLEGIQRQFRKAPLQPARSAAGPVPSTLDIDVRFEPPPDPAAD